MGTVDPLGPSRKRRIVRVTHEFDDDILLVAEIPETLPDLFHEVSIDIDGFLAEPERCDQVLHARALRMAFHVAQFAHGLHATDFYSRDLVWNEELFQRHLLPDFVVPDFDLDAAVQRTAFVGQI